MDSQEKGASEEDRDFQAPETGGEIDDVDKARKMAEAERPLRESSLAFRKVATEIRELVERNKEAFPGLGEQLNPIAERYEREAEHQKEYAVDNAEYSSQLHDRSEGRKE